MAKGTLTSAEPYIGPPFLSHVLEFVRNEFTRRSQKRIRPITPFVKAIPGFNFNDNAHPKIILKGIADLKIKVVDPVTKKVKYVSPINYTFRNLYRPSQEFRPLPGITSLSVEYKNVTGAIRKANMVWMCHTLADLESLSPYFLNPGRTMMLEWGWSELNSNTVLTDDDAYPKTYSLRTYYKKVRANVIKSNGNYDAMLGIITNYGFTMNPDGGYTCTTEVTSVGDLMRGIEIANQHTIVAKEDAKSSESDQVPSIVQTLRQFVERTLDAQIEEDAKNSKFISTDPENDTFIFKENVEYNAASPGTKDTIAGASKPTSASSNTSNSIPEEGKCTTFLSWGYIEDYIINKYTMIQYGKPGDATSPIFLVDNSLSKFRWNEWLRSTDLDICLIPETRAKSGNFILPPACHGISPDNKIEFFSPRKMLVNMRFFKNVVLNSKTLDDVIINTWSKINDACANFWTLKVKTQDEVDVWPKSIYITEGGTLPASLISIVDYNYGQEEIYSDNVFVFRVLPSTPSNAVTGEGALSTSIIRSINLSSKLSNDAAVNVFYSVNSTDRRTLGNQVSLWTSLFDYKINSKNSPSDDFIQDGLHLANPKLPQPTNQQPAATKSDAGPIQVIFELMNDYPPEFLVFLPVKFPPSFANNSGKYIDPLYDPIVEKSPDKAASTLTDGREVMRVALQQATQGATIAANKQAVIPLTCDIELEGIAGFRAGDIFTVDNIPTVYKERGVFQMVNISHEIDKNTWRTKIRGSFRVQITTTNGAPSSPKSWSEMNPQEKMDAAARLDGF